MKRSTTISIFLLFFLLTAGLNAQTVVRGIVFDAANNEPLIGAGVIIEGTSIGTVSDWDGSFEFETEMAYPFTLEVSYISFETKMVEVVSDARLTINLEEASVEIGVVDVKASRISDKQKESPLTVEAMDIIAIKETPSADFYDGLGSLKGVDLTAASLGFKVVNTRGFNSTSPVRSLQIIDGVDNQAPGLNFSLGNFLGTSELDINKVELIVGASSAFYGPNAFNGVISMRTKDPFFKEGLSAMVKVAERQQIKGAIRWADAIKNKEDNKVFAYKLNLEYFQANDWEAENYDPVYDSDVTSNNPGGYDAVNIYGDEYQSRNDFGNPASFNHPGLGQFSRTGYREKDLVDYRTRNLKSNLGLYFRTNPSKKEQSPEFVFTTNFGTGTTVYQGDNRFSLKGITFLQNTLEFKKRNKYFVRAYTTRTGAGNTYDPYFTALELQERAKPNSEWSIDYFNYWVSEIEPRFQDESLGYPQLVAPYFDPVTGELVITPFDTEGAEQWLIDNNGLVSEWHAEAAAYANGPGNGTSQSTAFLDPNSDDPIEQARFEEAFNDITGTLSSEGGTKFFDNSALYHIHGEYIFTPTWTDKITVGANGRMYTPRSKGTVFRDSTDEKINNKEFGVYAGLEKGFFDNKLKAQVAFRTDKNENFKWLFSPAASLVYTPSQNNFFRVSFSSAIRNPTLSDQYLSLNVGRAILSGNLDGVENLVTVESLFDAFSGAIGLDPSQLDSFNIAAVQPERVQTFELGARTTLFDKVYVDAGYYYSIYKDFLGYQIGVDFDYFSTGQPKRLQAYRYAANSENTVTTQGISVGINYYFIDKFSLNGNYSWNKLLKAAEDDPIIPAFNTPEHKFNVGIGGRNLTLKLGKKSLKHIGFNINYKWVEGFLFEGSPQFTGFVPTYDMLDAQVNVRVPKIHTTFKLGASNILNNKRFQTYGGPRISRMTYLTITYEP